MPLLTIQIASVCGRYFAMDRDQRWERIKQAYDVLVDGQGGRFLNALDGIQNSYNANVTDEFIKPFIVTDENGNYNEESVNKIGFAIFNMATSNQFNSNVYARLCSKLLSKYDFMNSIIDNNITNAIFFLYLTTCMYAT